MQNAYQIDLFNRKKNPFTSEYKIYHDGSHYIARKSVKGLKRKTKKRECSKLTKLFDFLFDWVRRHERYAENKQKY